MIDSEGVLWLNANRIVWGDKELGDWVMKHNLSWYKAWWGRGGSVVLESEYDRAKVILAWNNFLKLKLI